MRIWDVNVKDLCRKHLLGEHRELHGLWNILTKHGGAGGYSHHPETKRWARRECALYKRHGDLVGEMKKRGYNHHSSLDEKLVKGECVQDFFIDTIEKQKDILRNKNCECYNDIK